MNFLSALAIQNDLLLVLPFLEPLRVFLIIVSEDDPEDGPSLVIVILNRTTELNVEKNKNLIKYLKHIFNNNFSLSLFYSIYTKHFYNISQASLNFKHQINDKV